MRKIFFLSFLVYLVLHLVGCKDSTSPVEVSLKTTSYLNMQIQYVEVVSIVDAISLEGMDVNRGTCTVRDKVLKSLPLRLHYGQKTSISVMHDCDIRELTLKTSRGDWQFNFN